MYRERDMRMRMIIKEATVTCPGRERAFVKSKAAPVKDKGMFRSP